MISVYDITFILTMKDGTQKELCVDCLSCECGMFEKIEVKVHNKQERLNCDNCG